MSYTAASQQGAIETFWLHYGELSGCPSLYTVYGFTWDTNTGLLGESPGLLEPPVPSHTPQVHLELSISSLPHQLLNIPLFTETLNTK